MLLEAPADLHRILIGSPRALDERILALAAEGKEAVDGDDWFRTVIIDRSGRFAGIAQVFDLGLNEHTEIVRDGTKVPHPRSVTVDDISTLGKHDAEVSLRAIANTVPRRTRVIYRGCEELLGNWGVISDLGDWFQVDRRDQVQHFLALTSSDALDDKPNYGGVLRRNAVIEEV